MTITFNKTQTTSLLTMAADDVNAEIAFNNHRTQAFKTLTALYATHKAPPMADFKAALSLAIGAYFGKPSKAETRPKAPQVFRDWCGRLEQANKAGIKPAALKGKTESEVRAEIVKAKAVASGADKAAIEEKAGENATLAQTQAAIKSLENPEVETERKAVQDVMTAIKNSLKELDHDGRMTYLASLLTSSKSKPQAPAKPAKTTKATKKAA
jgi:hypothetical protein